MTRRQVIDALARAALRGYFKDEGGFIDMSSGAHLRAVAKVGETLDLIIKQMKEEDNKPILNPKYVIRVEWSEEYKYNTPSMYQKLDGKVLVFNRKEDAEEWVKALSPHKKMPDASYSIMEVSEEAIKEQR